MLVQLSVNRMRVRICLELTRKVGELHNLDDGNGG